MIISTAIAQPPAASPTYPPPSSTTIITPPATSPSTTTPPSPATSPLSSPPPVTTPIAPVSPVASPPTSVSVPAPVSAPPAPAPVMTAPPPMVIESPPVPEPTAAPPVEAPTTAAPEVPAPAPSKSKKKKSKMSPAPAPELMSPPAPPAEAPGPGTDDLSPGPSAAIADDSGAERLKSVVGSLDYLNDLVIKYKILRDLHPRLPSEEFVMSELPDDSIGIYHRVFDFFGVRVPFSSFLLDLIKHYRVHFSQLGPLGNQGGSSVAPTAEGSNTRDSRGKVIMADDVVAPSVSVSQPRPSFGTIPSFKDVSRYVIHADFFPFSAGPYYATYPEGGVAGNYEFTREEWDASYRPTFGNLTKEVFKVPAICKTIVDQFPILREMVRVKSLSDDQLTGKMSVLHCMMMSHGGELLALYRWLNQSHHDVYLEEAGFRLNDKLSSSDASFVKSKAKGKERKKKIKFLTKSLDNLHAEVARLSADLNRATILEAEKDEKILHLKATPPEFSSFFRDQFQGLVRNLPFVAQTDYSFLNKIFEHATEPLSVILQLELEKLTRPANVPTSRDARVSPLITKELIVTPTSKSLKLSTNVALDPSVVALEQNKEWGISYVLDDVAEVTAVGSKRVSPGPTDVVVALSVGEIGDGSLPSSAADEEAAANPSGV
nr:hypothetical protein [Tanacetum cinerariifolium]